MTRSDLNPSVRQRMRDASKRQTQLRLEAPDNNMKPNAPAERQPPPEGKDLIVFDIVRDSRCADCGKELLAHDFLFMEGERPLCLTCADLDQLV